MAKLLKGRRVKNLLSIAITVLAVGCSSNQTVAPTASATNGTSITSTPTINEAATLPNPTRQATVAMSATTSKCSAGWIVFVSHVGSFEKDVRNGVYKTCADGSVRQQLISSLKGLPVLAWPDGKRFAYVDDQSLIQLVDLEGHSLGTLQIGNTSKGDVGRLSISPDGAYIFYLRMSKDYPGVGVGFEVVHLSTGNISKDVAPLSYYERQGINGSSYIPSWSPKGDHIAWRVADRLDVADIVCDDSKHTCDLQNIRDLGIAPHAVGNSNISWSPDGKMLAASCTLTHDSNEDFRLCVFDLNGRLTESFGTSEIGVRFVGNPAWSPDGDRIAFSNGERLYVLSLADKKVIDLTANYGTRDDVPIWIP